MKLVILACVSALAILLSIYVFIQINVSEHLGFFINLDDKDDERRAVCSPFLFEYFKKVDAGNDLNEGVDILNYINCSLHHHLNDSSLSLIKKQVSSELIVKPGPVYNAEDYAAPIEIEWFNYDQYESFNTKVARNASLAVWSKALTMSEHQKLMDLFRMITTLFSKHNIEFMLTEGSLMGSMRHFDQIPWDDDADILIHSKHKKNFTKLIKTQTLFPELETVGVGNILKVFTRDSVNAGKYKWKFPFIDIFFYQENSTHIDRLFRNKKIVTPKQNIFPLKLRPFGKYWLPTPKDPIKYLERLNYVDFHKSCQRATWSHRLEKNQKQAAINCAQLQSLYPMSTLDCFKTDQGEEFCAENLIFNQRKLIVLINYSNNYLVINLDIFLE